MKQLAGYFRCGREDVPIFDGGNSIAPMEPYRAPGELRAVAPAPVVYGTRPLTADVARDIGAAYCTPRRYDAMTGRMWEDDYEEDEPQPRRRRTVQAPPAVEPQPVVQPMPVELPVAVPDWPMPAVVEPEPVPVVVNRTAARFGALEIRRD